MMSRRFTGVALIFVSAFLFSARFVAAAIFGSSISNNWSANLFNAMLQYVGSGLVNWSIIALIVGIGYLIWVEFDAWKSDSNENAQSTNLKFNIEEVNYVIRPEID